MRRGRGEGARHAFDVTTRSALAENQISDVDRCSTDPTLGIYQRY